ncbi:MAG: TIGR03960 family B12-binding radical SAM protein [Desulfobacterales bacterium]|uniref:TIGR03960 family B12-binding radical SAM protein n=1 Tax=Candidatus Desulfaltia bathyphila TaxID=2841697 RepID=A0A8J6N4G8_9BACT|nr:TIGR03960 family B12-binding radical SAM protein [Candidatus Desulfaltia bathyphila]MBL7206928.1 TIGR03960 family B12-binding radical SAM protein [Desulfobacterales bacterium]
MSIKNFQDILPLVERPSRYLGTEINSIKKDPDKVKLKVALAFPDLYEIGISHFGLQILYDILNKHKEIVAERVYAPDLDMESYLRSSHMPLVSMESHNPLKSFDIIGFSLLYELNYTNVLTMLDLSGIPFFSSERDGLFPLIIAGGPCTCNPEPVADFFDALVVGDGENVIVDISRAWLAWKEDGSEDKEVLLKQLSLIKGVYVPAFFNLTGSSAGSKTFFQIPQPRFSDYKVIAREIIADLDTAPFPDAPIVPFGKPVHDRLRIEIARGCTRGCRFCQAGMIYRPVRERSVNRLLNLFNASCAATGYEDLSLLSLSTADYGSIISLIERLMFRCEPRQIAVSLPSLRAGTLTPELINLIKRVRKTGFTIAPEAGSQRLREVINKNITEKEIFDTVQDVFGFGWMVIKLYFMIGFPSETDEDLPAIVELVKRLRRIKSRAGRRGQINVSVATFIPKPHTPFQWASQISLAESREKIEWLRANLKMPGIHFKWQNPEVSMLEGLFARGDRRLGGLLVDAYKKGCKFDGWGDRFQYGLWKKAFSDQELDTDSYTTCARDVTDRLPWDHIDTGVTKEFLKLEWEKAKRGEHTPDCRRGDCNTCGVCDFKTIEPKVFEVGKEEPDQDIVNEFLYNKGGAADKKAAFYTRVRLCYSKQGRAKYFGHLELVNIFLRAMRRAGILLKFTEGFHPMPKVSFDDPLPIGMESLNETLHLVVCGSVRPDAVITGLNNHLPEGLLVKDCQISPSKPAIKQQKSATYLVELKEGCFDKQKLDDFVKSSDFVQTRVNRKGKLKKIDFKDLVLKINLTDPCRMIIRLRSEPGRTARPFEIIKGIFNLSEEIIKQATIIKQ